MKQCPICTTGYSDEHKTCPTDGAVLLATSDWSPGTLIRGKYRIIAKIGRGGMGTVYKAEHITLEEVRALKVMTPTADPEFVHRFRREAQAARRLRHPNVVQVDDLDQADDGSFFIAMDYMDGVSLRERLHATQGPLPLLRTLKIVRCVADALAAAHTLGMVHRDIKPENILLARDSQGREIPKILDFGIVAMQESSATQVTSYLLTPSQGSPEQWKGMKASELDGRADLYALGCVWYEMLTGRLPLHAHTYEGWMRAHLYEIPEPPSKFNPELAQYPSLDALVLKLLAKDREQRPLDAQAFLQELNLIEGQLTLNEAALATPRTPDDGATIFASSAKEAAFLTPPPSRTVPLPQPPVEAPSITTTPAASVEATASRRGSRVALILAVAAVIVAFVVFGVIYRSRNNAPNSVALRGQDQTSQPSIPSAAPPIPPEGVSGDQLPDNQTTTQPQSNKVERTPQTPSSLKAKESIESTGASTDKGAQSGQTLQNAPTIVPPPLLNPPAGPSGELYKNGALLEANGKLSEAVNSYQASCDGGEPGGCGKLGAMYASGRGVAKDESRASQLFQKGCDGGYAAGCTGLGAMYAAGRGVAKDESRAAQLFQKGCDGGYAVGCTGLGVMYAAGRGVAKDESRASQLYQKGCDGGYAVGCTSLGAMYEGGRGVAKDEGRASQLYQKSCDAGYAVGCASLGTMYAAGRGVAVDEGRAAQLYQKGCDGGYAVGCTRLGAMYAVGLGMAKDESRAAQFYQKGCDLGDSDGCANVHKPQTNK